MEAVWSFQEEIWSFWTGSQERISEIRSSVAAVCALHSLEALLGTEKMKQEDAKLKPCYAIQEYAPRKGIEQRKLKRSG